MSRVRTSSPAPASAAPVPSRNATNGAPAQRRPSGARRRPTALVVLDQRTAAHAPARQRVADVTALPRRGRRGWGRAMTPESVEPRSRRGFLDASLAGGASGRRCRRSSAVPASLKRANATPIPPGRLSPRPSRSRRSREHHAGANAWTRATACGARRRGILDPGSSTAYTTAASGASRRASDSAVCCRRGRRTGAADGQALERSWRRAAVCPGALHSCGRVSAVSQDGPSAEHPPAWCFRGGIATPARGLSTSCDPPGRCPAIPSHGVDGSRTAWVE